DEQLATLAIEAHPPRIAKAISPNLGPRVFEIDERVVARDGVVLATLAAIDIDPQNRRKQVGNILARVKWIRRVWVCRVASRNVEQAIGAEVEIAGVVTALEKGEDDDLARRINPWRLGIRDSELGDARTVFQIS